MRKIAALTSLAGVAIVLSGCGILGSTSSAAVGECVTLDVNSTTVSELKGFSCADEHDAEIFQKKDVSLDGGYDQAAVDTLAVDLCLAAFKEYVGIDYEASTLDVYYLYPDETSWKSGDREVVCAVYTPNADFTDGVPTTGSVKGSKK